jgi:LacI family transcriptional regulator
MRDVATLAGVGLATVSRVVNGKSGVAPDLVERVTDAARMLGYRHDHTASSLRRADRRTYTIGMIVENVANPFSSALHRAVEDAAEERGLLLVSGSNDEDPGRERRLIENFTERRVDGLIVVPTGHATDELLAAARRGISLVCVDRAPGFDNVDSVTVDNREGVRDAVRRLHEIGHQRIAYLGDLTRIWTARERYAGFVEGIALAGGPLDERLVRHEIHREQDAYQVALEYFSLDSPPSAILSAQNLITVGARRALQVLGLERRIAQIGFDDIPLADLLVPKVSAIAQNMHELGRKAAELLFARLDGDQSPPRQVVLPTRYIARGSGEIPPTRVWP